MAWEPKEPHRQGPVERCWAGADPPPVLSWPVQPILNSRPVKRLTRPLRARLKSVVTRVRREQVASLRAELDEGRRKVQDAGTRVEQMRSVIASLQREERSFCHCESADLNSEVANACAGRSAISSGASMASWPASGRSTTGCAS